jgi:hypothetical protein
VSILIDLQHLAWAAGIFDGEGSITTSKDSRNNQITLLVSVQMTDELTIKRLHSLFGVGRVNQIRKSGKHNNLWTYQASGKDAVYVVSLINSYLFTKSRQGELALEWGEKCLKTRANIPEDVLTLREIIREELSLLNKRGK